MYNFSYWKRENNSFIVSILLFSGFFYLSCICKHMCTHYGRYKSISSVFLSCFAPYFFLLWSWTSQIWTDWLVTEYPKSTCLCPQPWSYRYMLSGSVCLHRHWRLELGSSCLGVRLIHFYSHLSSALKGFLLSWLLFKTKKHRTSLCLLHTSRHLEFLHNVSSHDVMDLGIIVWDVCMMLLSELLLVLLSCGL